MQRYIMEYFIAILQVGFITFILNKKFLSLLSDERDLSDYSFQLIHKFVIWKYFLYFTFLTSHLISALNELLLLYLLLI